MYQLLGILGLIGYGIAIIGAAAGSTWLIVKLFPAPEDRDAMRLEDERLQQAGAPPATS